MCTLTYIPPQVTGLDKTLFTSNRDEQLKRAPAIPPQWYEKGPYALAMPVDPAGSGTWVSADNRGNAVCLLNGGFERYTPSPPYKHSRGLVVTGYFEYGGFDQFVKEYDFNGLEPFTLVVTEGARLYELRWDGQKIFTEPKDPELPHIWSSVTLYGPALRQIRSDLFYAWLQEHKETLREKPERILDFHRFKGKGDASKDIEIEREGKLKTVSITAVRFGRQSVEMLYLDTIADSVYMLSQQ
jgi:hypothetical protein